MPLYPPRNEPIKKKEQLSQREIELRFAISNNLSADKINKAAEKYRSAQLSLLKAKIHEFWERQYQKKPQLSDVESIENEIQGWMDKPVELIIKDLSYEL